MAGPIDKRLVSRGRATRNFLVALTLVGVLSSALIIVQARVLSDGLSAIFATHRVDGLSEWVGVLAFVFVGRAGLAWLSSWLAHRSSAAVKSQLRHDVLAAPLSRPTGSAAASSTLVTLLTQGLDALDGYYSKYLPQLVLAVVVPLLVGVTIATQDLISAIIVAVTLPLIPVFMALIGWTTAAQVRRRWAVQTKLAGHFADLVTGLPTLQVFGRARAQRTGLDITENRHRAETMKTLRISFLSAFALELLATVSVALVAVSVGFRVVFAELDLRTALFILILAPEAYLPVRQVGVHYHDAADGVAAAQTALDIIDSGTPPSAGGAVPDGPVVFDDVSVVFPAPDAAGPDTPALTGFSLTLAPGEVVALAGRSGGGKTTAINVLLGHIAPTSGTVTIGGTPLAEVDADAWQSRLAYVGQTPGMLRGSIARNVRLGFPAASADQVRQALADAGAVDLDPGRDVGDDAEGLSAGERRRVALARALLRVRLGGARWFVLDEPTAGLDSDAEAAVVRAVRDSGAGVLVVTHRPAVLAAVDRVVEVTADAPVAPPVAGRDR